MHWIFPRLFVLTLTFQIGLCLTQSDGYNIGVVLGSIIGGLLAIGIAGVIIYFCCLRRWLGIGDPPDLGYARQNDYNLKKKQAAMGGGRPITIGFGDRGKAAPVYGGGGQKNGGGVIQGKTPAYTTSSGGGGNQGRSPGATPPSSADTNPYGEIGNGARLVPPRFEGPSGGHLPAVALSGGNGSEHRRHSTNSSYSSESELRTAAAVAAARQGFEATASNRSAYQARGGNSGGSPSLPAAYLGTGV